MASSPRVRVVTDSTCALPAALAAAAGLATVPLHVVVDGAEHLEGVDVDDDALAAAIVAGARVTTSQPTPAAFARVYARVADEGAADVVSVHLSGELSGTVHSAAAGAAGAPVNVRVVDSRSAATGMGFAALEAARAAERGADARTVEQVALRVASSATTLFLVGSLDHLRRGGRLTRAAAALGNVLGMRPLLTLRDGRIEVLAKVRTRAAAIDRLVEIAREAAARAARPLVAVHHLDTPADAAALAARLDDVASEPVLVGPVGAVLGAHVGPGLLAVVVVDADA
ncbi:DegV family protein [Flavimobilis sp. GY10621]|uniref:DegV family protein n=1 Tax=Flavimobilis rhizosphaerae TaxID=2775421 RepID=A0ABR9DSL4_9MICO|nr:DegV family protein [Flavimobilis rhizosphaerae]MBD9700112.1 DegV family protein [Flavimobilis rhizosphaerae]